MADPALAAGGATVFPATGDARADRPRPSPPETLVGQEVATFALGPVGDRHGRRRRHRAGRRRSPRPSSRAQVEPDHQLVAGLGRDRGRRRGRRRPDGQLPGHGIGPAGRGPRPERPRRSWSSASRSTRRSAILEPFGTVEISVSPDWVRLDPELREPGRPDRRPRRSRSRRRPRPARPRRDPPARHRPRRAARSASPSADDDGSAARPLATLRRGTDLDADAAALRDGRRRATRSTSWSSGCRSRRPAPRVRRRP